MEQNERVEVACAYCDQTVEYTDADPVAVALIERWRPWDEDADHTFYAHRACFVQTLHPEVQQDLAP